MDWSGLFASISSLWQSFPTLPLAGKIAGILVVLIGLIKSSVLQPLWAKAGPWKVVIPPVLGLVVAILSIQPLSWAGVWLGLTGGVLAVGIANLLDAVKLIPGVGPTWITAIDFVEKLLKAPAPTPAQQEEKVALLKYWKK